MKKVLLIISAAALLSCGQSKKEAEASGKKVVCDSVMESTFDANGNEITAKKYRCDTVPETK